MTASNGASGAAADPFPAPSRKLRLGIVGGGRGSFIGPVHLNGAPLSGRWDLVAAAPSSRPDVARASGRDMFLQDNRVHVDFRSMAEAEAARADGIDAVAIVTPNATHTACCAIRTWSMAHGAFGLSRPRPSPQRGAASGWIVRSNPEGWR